ncbi:5-dehydro-4-deoxyglucarate dehydratase [Planomonospora parontospora]|uniref:5-dehydro-4-deoxyglucarate dehydratase n=1 Tax=Planomonospora parontospora TaxID=58119 RepID=UPI001670F5B1|nr:5-dehydro-4-deoxyglucarate dehydratase [Planomonospora parontospora]GGL07179.1 putative 5-dehydro-4-deoxyglucarate dehydratase 1 [Planomonospora parontospora subsp. antibiotica]GII14123.1 putative 5-dehydro-4-deoxyglucarate dehydratase 1 [Planomonospora parontospora subsp. antibiotica]
MNLSGVLFFPVTPFDAEGALAEDVLAEHIGRNLEHRPGGVFVACGTGEFSALSQAEHTRAVEVAVKTVQGAVPVLAGAGGPLGAALEQARAARAAGADGLLLMPPYLMLGSRAGFAEYVRAVAAELPVIVYQRGALVLEPDAVVELARIPGVIGLKDGLGDIDRFQRTVLAVRREIGPDFTFFNGLPTAELTMPAYRGLGVELYSSAVFAFAPEIATAYFNGGDLSERLLTEFYAPLVELRGKGPGYAVALVKAGLRLRGLDVGPVRAPLTDVAPEHLAELDEIIKRGLALVSE